MKPNVLFLGSTYAGHATRFANLQTNVEADGRLRPTFRRVTGWNSEGRIEKLPGIPRGIKGRFRATCEASPLAKFPRPDAIWTSAREELLPFIWCQSGPFRRPLVLDLDATDEQLESMATHYFGRSAKTGLAAFAARKQESAIWHAVSVFTPWSNWAAEGLRKAGVANERIVVIPPGVDTNAWQPATKEPGDRPLRVLFVGGDFERKGGKHLLEVARILGNQIDVCCVTRPFDDDVPTNVRIMAAEANTPELRKGFAWADVFVLPSLAECFGIATVEAMASGLPVIATNVGGTPDIVEDGVTGWLIEPGFEPLLHSLRLALRCRSSLTSLGAKGRQKAERKFDSRSNHHRLVDTVISLLERPG